MMILKRKEHHSAPQRRSQHSCQDNGVLTWWRIYSCVLFFSPGGTYRHYCMYSKLLRHGNGLNPPGDTAVEKL